MRKDRVKKSEMRKEHYDNLGMFYKRCPICTRKFIGMGAISRKDNRTEICSECGLEEAMFDFYNYLQKK